MKIPLPGYDPINGAFVINPREAAVRLGDDIERNLRSFHRQTLPEIQANDFLSETELTALVIHYRLMDINARPCSAPILWTGEMC